MVLVFVGGCVGALGRYAADRLIQSRHAMLFPWGTFAANMTGSALLGVVAGGVSSSSSWVFQLVGTGFCGALTTFSTFGFETYRLLDDRALLEAGLNVLASVLVGLGCLLGGYELGHALL